MAELLIREKPDYLPEVVWGEYLKHSSLVVVEKAFERLIMDRHIWEELRKQSGDSDVLNCASRKVVSCTLLGCSYIHNDCKVPLISEEKIKLDGVKEKATELSKEIKRIVGDEGSLGELYECTHATTWQFIAMREYPAPIDAKTLPDMLDCLTDCLQEMIEELDRIEPTHKHSNQDIHVKMMIRYLAREFYGLFGKYLGGTIARCTRAITGRDNIDRYTDVNNALKTFDYKKEGSDFLYGGLLF